MCVSAEKKFSLKMNSILQECNAMASMGVRFLGPKTFLSVVTQGMFVKQSMYNRILIDYITNCTSTNVQTKIKLKP